MSMTKLILIALSCVAVLGGCRKATQPPKPTATVSTPASTQSAPPQTAARP